MNAALVRILSGKSDIDPVAVGFGVEPFDRFERNAFKPLFAFGGLVQNFLKSLLFPTLLFGVNAELKRGLSGLATIGATAPFVGLFGTTVGIINAFKGMSSEKTAGLSAVAGGISEALVTTAFGLFVAVPAVWAYNYFTNKVEAFAIEMTNSSSELIDYFIKQQSTRSGKR